MFQFLAVNIGLKKDNKGNIALALPNPSPRLKLIENRENIVYLQKKYYHNNMEYPKKDTLFVKNVRETSQKSSKSAATTATIWCQNQKPLFYCTHVVVFWRAPLWTDHRLLDFIKLEWIRVGTILRDVKQVFKDDFLQKKIVPIQTYCDGETR